MLIIRHRSGPLAGKEQRLESKTDRIMFGRDPAVCDVVFPPDATIVARRHFALVRKPSGEWTLDLFGDPFVAMNGEPADVGAAIHSGSVIELGRHGGPSFEVTLEGEGLADQLPVTQPQEKVEGSHAAALQAEKGAARARRLAVAGVAIALLAAVGGGTFMYLTRDQATRLDSAVAALKEAQERAASASIGPEVRDKLLKAAYLVVIKFASGQETLEGTASPIAADTLATNAHIVEAREKLATGDRMFVRAPGANGREYEVIDSKKHPGYDAFNKFLTEDPLYVMAAKGCPTCLPSTLSASLSYDVGILRVAAGSALGPILEIAGSDELAKLQPGLPIALAGYPGEHILGSEVLPLGATPTLGIGIVTSMTDMFVLPADYAELRLVHHNIPVTGGNSGSPILDASGRIVALLNSGNVFVVPNIGRIPNAALINYAQRADLLSDLISGRAEETLDAERAYWVKQTASFKRGIDFIVPKIVEELKPKTGGTPVLISQAKFALSTSEQVKTRDNNGKEVARRQRSHAVTLSAGKPQLFIAYADGSAPLQIFLVVDGNNIVAKDDRNNIWYPDLSYTSNRDIQAEVYVVGGDRDVSYTFIDYGWQAPPS